MRISTLAACGLCVLAASAAHAQNIVVDPGFESATPGLHEASNPAPFPAALGDGAWTTTLGGVSVVNATVLAHSGSNSLDISPGNIGGISQTLVTVPGHAYDLSFFAEANFVTNAFSASFGGNVVFAQALPRTGLGTARYLQYTVPNLVAPSSSTVLTFNANSGNENADIFLDDVSVVARAAAVPEPGSLALLAGLVVPATLLLRRRRA
jgi:hypothetical protein